LNIYVVIAIAETAMLTVARGADLSLASTRKGGR
jgi:hypothetical protein